MGGVLEWSLEERWIEGNAAGIQARSESGLGSGGGLGSERGQWI